MPTRDPGLSFDEKLREAVLKALNSDATTSALDLRVGVLNAIVHLGGTAASEEQWERAEQIAGELPGVRGVVNRIEAPGAPSPSRTIHLNLTSISEIGGQDERQP